MVSAMLVLTSVLAGVADPPAKAGRPDTAEMVQGARAVVAAVVKAAKKNRRRPARGSRRARPPLRRKGDALTEYYVRAAARAARKLPAKQAVHGYLLGLGVALDRDDLLRQNPVSGWLWRRVESDDERRDRLKVLGKPTVHGRHDLAQHFGVSAALTAATGAKAAEAAGILKEMLDAEGESGFSFADLAADLAGIAFAERLLGDPGRLAQLAKSFRVKAHVLPPRGLAEGLTSARFAERYGSVRDKRFQAALEDLKKQTRALPGYSDKATGR
jgi:hypothetical protein